MTTRQFILTALLLAAGSLSADANEKIIGSLKIKIQADDTEFFEPTLPVDPVRRVEFQNQPGMMLRVTYQNQQLHLGVMSTILKIDGRVQFFQGAGNDWRLSTHNVPLPKIAGKERDGVYSVYTIGRVLRITQKIEVVPGRKPGLKLRQRDTVLVRYTIENIDTVAHKVGLRKSMDVFIIDNDGALFAAPNQPGKILDGVELRDKMMPDYLQFLQRPNLQDPGFVAHMTFALGNAVERPNRAILTSLAGFGLNNWDMAVMPARGDSAMSIYWDPQEIKPNAKRELAFAFGGGVASSLEEGKVKVDVTGSFEPGKLCTVNAYVRDPAQGQSLTLELPSGMEFVHGKATQPVPSADDDGNSLVQWQARVLRTGRFSLQVHSSVGATFSRNITTTTVDGK